ncbi:hypothetical protein D3C78_1428310 [compost metagenome]
MPLGVKVGGWMPVQLQYRISRLHAPICGFSGRVDFDDYPRFSKPDFALQHGPDVRTEGYIMNMNRQKQK